jgi:hypothetical protein
VLKSAFALPALLVVVGSGVFAAVQALPANEVEKIYYSDAAKTEEMGGALLSCYGGRHSWGQQTQYYIAYTTPCR